MRIRGLRDDGPVVTVVTAGLPPFCQAGGCMIAADLGVSVITPRSAPFYGDELPFHLCMRHRQQMYVAVASVERSQVFDVGFAVIGDHNFPESMRVVFTDPRTWARARAGALALLRQFTNP